MNTENQDFENLRRLLKLKRHEQPPPRYFNEFSGQVINRLQADVTKGRVESRSAAASEVPWLQRMLAIFEQKPILAGVFGAAVCGLLVAGAIYSDPRVQTDFAESSAPQIKAPAAIAIQAFAANPSLAFSTNPVSSGSLFETLPTLGIAEVENVVHRPFGPK